jgi:hypothetical protein
VLELGAANQNNFSFAPLLSHGGRHEHKSATSADGVIDSRHPDTRSAAIPVMDHRDLFDRSRRIGSARQIGLRD